MATGQVEQIEAGDPSLHALELMLEAWDHGAEAGVAPELLAYAALFTALTGLVDTFGEENVAGLARGLAGRVLKGEFSMPQQQAAYQ
jgi:hypothetical protein